MEQIKTNEMTQAAISILAEFDALADRIETAMDETLDDREVIDDESARKALFNLENGKDGYRRNIVDAITLAIRARLESGEYLKNGF